MSRGTGESRLAVLLFTDVVGSTELKHRLNTVTYARLLERHNAMFEGCIGRFGGEVLKHTGDGYFAAFATASDAVNFALAFQQAMRTCAWEDPSSPLTTRIGIHIGEVALVQMAGKPDVVGLSADIAARVMSLAAGGQILMTRTAFDDARQFVSAHPPAADEAAGAGELRLKWLAHGRYQFKGSDEPLEIFEIGADGHAPLRAPPSAAKAKRILDRDELQTLGWRPALGQALPNRPGWTLQRKVGSASFGEVWVGKNRSSGETRVFKFCFDPQRLESFREAATLVRVPPTADHDAGADHKPLDPSDGLAAPVFAESDYRDDATALEGVSGSMMQRMTDALDAGDYPQRIGPYRILEPIGQGGMGEVYKAEQTHPIRRIVALKLIKLGMDSKQVIARFESERQALAMMNHPNVAKVLDAGTSDTGRLYFVMEYVPGEPITGFCDRHSYTTKQRLELFVQACDAVQHAHQKAIIHRDLKPSNILVMLENRNPVVKVIDFGVAKATVQKLTERTLFTETGQLVGTPEYMSPEQAEMNPLDVDTTTDIYSLGVVLYELISGALPFDAKTLRSAGFNEIQRIIREVDPPRPSARLSSLGATAQEVARRRHARLDDLTSQLRGELEWIPLKAMRKDRAHRYETAAEFAHDIQNYLSDRPLVAGPESTRYRIEKFLRRHRGPVAAVAAVLIVVLMGATISTILAVRLNRTAGALEVALHDAQQANANRQAVIDFLARDVIGAVDPANTAGRDLTVHEALANAANTVAAGFHDQPLIEAAVRYALATSYHSLGKTADALEHIKAAVDLQRRAGATEDPEHLVLQHELAKLLSSRGNRQQAEEIFRKVLEGRRKHFGPDHADTLAAMNSLSRFLYEQGRFAEGEAIAREALDKTRRLFGNEHDRTISATNNLGLLLQNQKKLNEAEPLFRQALAAARRTLGDEHPQTLTSMNNLAQACFELGRLEEAEPLMREALQRRLRVLKEDHPETIISMNNLAWVLRRQNRLAEAEPLLRQAVERAPAAFGPEHPNTKTFKATLNDLLREMQQVQQEQQRRAEGASTQPAAQHPIAADGSGSN